jgi:hypothetical protein
MSQNTKVQEVQVPKLKSIFDFNAEKQCENGFEFEYVNENGEGTGFFITVIGDQAPFVKKAIYSKINKERTAEAILKKRGKDVPVKPIEELINDNAEGVAACIIGWRGVEEQYTPELAFQLVSNNKLIFDQIKDASENLANFTKSK